MTKRQKYNAPSHEISVVWGHDRARFQILRDGKGTARSLRLGALLLESRYVKPGKKRYWPGWK